MWPNITTKNFMLPVPTKKEWDIIIEVLLSNGFSWGGGKNTNSFRWKVNREKTIIFVRVDCSPKGTISYGTLSTRMIKGYYDDWKTYTVDEFLIKIGIIKKYKVRRIICKRD